MSKRLAVVTGGIGGLGTGICRHPAHDGRRVIAVDLPPRSERLEIFMDEVSDFDGTIGFAPADISDFDDCRALVEGIENADGDIDIPLNAAGITGDASLRTMTPAQWHPLMRVNFDSIFNIRRQPRGRRHVRVQLRSHRQPELGQRPDRPVRADQLLRREGRSARFQHGAGTAERAQGRHGERGLPWLLRTRRWWPRSHRPCASRPWPHPGGPPRLARAVAFLAADDADYITGANLPVNGGYAMRF